MVLINERIDVIVNAAACKSSWSTHSFLKCFNRYMEALTSTKIRSSKYGPFFFSVGEGVYRGTLRRGGYRIFQKGGLRPAIRKAGGGGGGGGGRCCPLQARYEKSGGVVVLSASGPIRYEKYRTPYVAKQEAGHVVSYELYFSAPKRSSTLDPTRPPWAALIHEFY